MTATNAGDYCAQRWGRVSDLTQAELKRILSYNPDTGQFHWLVTRANRRAGSVAGTVRGHKRPRAVIKIDTLAFHASRLAWLYMTGSWPSVFVDHIDGDSLNDRWSNLREATSSQNCANRRLRSNSKSGIKGVSWHKVAKRWRVRICLHGKRIYLGSFKTREAAHAAYKAGAEKYFGEFAHA